MESCGQQGILDWLELVTKEQPEAAKEVEFWRMTKDTRLLRCVVRYMPSGLDLRLMLGDEFRTTELHKDAPSVQTCADEWRTALLERGWTGHGAPTPYFCGGALNVSNVSDARWQNRPLYRYWGAH